MKPLALFPDPKENGCAYFFVTSASTSSSSHK